jgi:glucose-6-phosphate isomerase
MIRVEDHGRELPIASAYSDLDAIGYLGGAGLGQLLNREQRGTELGLLKAQRPVLTLSLPQLNAFTIGQLFYLFEVAVIFAAGLYRIDPFNQPGVEESKRLTYGLMGRKGFEHKRAEVEQLLARKRAENIV